MGVNYSFLLNGKALPIPKDFFDVGIKASFEDDVQGNITTEEFTFVLGSYQEIVNWIKDGNKGGVGIFEGIPISILSNEGTTNVSLYSGILDLQSGTTIQPNLKKITTRLRQNSRLNNLSDLLEPLDFGYLKDINVIRSSDYVDVDYTVNVVDKGVITITTLITGFLLGKTIIDGIESIAKSLAIKSGFSAVLPNGPPGGILYLVLSTIFRVFYLAALLVLIVNLSLDLFRILVPPRRTHKAIKLRTLIERTCQHIGYIFNTNIKDLDHLVYLPSNRHVDTFKLKNVLKKAGTISEGIPHVSDIGYSCPELFQAVKNMFNGRFAIYGNTLHFHTKSDPFWESQSTWIKTDVMKDQAKKEFRYNTDEMKSSIFINFKTDISDVYTIKNYKGTSYQVLTDAKAVKNPLNKTIKTLDRVDIPFALGNRKETLSGFEESIASLGGLFDEVSGLLGNGTNIASNIRQKINLLEVSNNNHSIPKLLWMNGSKIPKNHRDLFSAKTLWEKYHIEKSFVQNNGKRQRVYFENEVIPFSLKDFISLSGNSFFKMISGEKGKVTEIEWNFSKDTAKISYWKEEKYTSNLKETNIEVG